jgi:hypothetical protein
MNIYKKPNKNDEKYRYCKNVNCSKCGELLPQHKDFFSTTFNNTERFIETGKRYYFRRDCRICRIKILANWKLKNDNHFM